MNKNRIEAFSDAVMAVAITLLALDLKVEPKKGLPLSSQLWEQWPAFAAFAVSFFVIGAVWISHHELFRMATGADSGVLVANLLLLLFVTAIPFVTATYADYAQRGDDNTRVAVIAYGVVMTGMSVSFTLILRAMLSANLFKARLTPDESRKLVFKYGIGALIYPVMTIVGLILIRMPIMPLLYVPVVIYYFGPGARILNVLRSADDQ